MPDPTHAPDNTPLAAQSVGHRLARSLWPPLAVLVVLAFLPSVGLYARRLAQDCLVGECEFWVPNWLASADHLARAGLPVAVYVGLLVVLEVVFAAVHVGVAAILYWRARHNRVALLGAYFLLCWGVTFPNALYDLKALHPAWNVFVVLVAIIGGISLYTFFALFPSGTFEPRWMRHVALAWVAVDIALEVAPDDAPLSDNLLLVLCALAGMLGLLFGLVAAQVYRYKRVSTPAQKLQTKWVVYGVSVSISGVLLLLMLGSWFPLPASAPVFWSVAFNLGYYGLMLVIPLSLLAAIRQSRLWAIDLIIRRTLIYTLLSASLALVYLGSVLVLTQLVVLLTGQARSELVTALSTLAVAAAFAPLRARVKTFIDRRFYRRQYNTARTLGAFGASLRDDVDLATMRGELLAVVNETMQPAHVSLWLEPISDVEPGGI